MKKKGAAPFANEAAAIGLLGGMKLPFCRFMPASLMFLRGLSQMTQPLLKYHTAITAIDRIIESGVFENN